jgi:hypothetical protein
MTGDGLHQTVGERGIGVQVSGDGNTTIIYAGAVELVLARKHLRKATPATEFELLRVDLRAWFRICSNQVTRARGKHRPGKARFQLERRPIGRRSASPDQARRG